ICGGVGAATAATTTGALGSEQSGAQYGGADTARRSLAAAATAAVTADAGTGAGYLPFAAITGAGQHAAVCDVSGRKNTDHAHPTGAAENMEPVFSTPAMVAAGNARPAAMAAYIQRLKNAEGGKMRLVWCLTLFFFSASVQALTLTDD